MKLVEHFEKYIASVIDKKGIWPHAMVVEKADGTMSMHALDLNPDQCWMHFINATTLDKAVSAAIMGLDRTTRPGQGTEFADVLTCVLYEPSPALEYRVRDQFRFGVINYQHEPRIVRPMDWNNEFWNRQLRAELSSFLPPLVIKRRA